MNAVPEPNMKAKPQAQKSTPQRQVSTMHSMSTLTVSRERQKPASSIVKPTCMPNTRNAATSVHTVLIGLTMSLPASGRILGAHRCRTCSSTAIITAEHAGRCRAPCRRAAA